MTKKWRVEKHGDEWEVITHRRRIHKWYETYAEAINEAQKLARSVVVELPVIPRHTSRMRLPAHNGTPDRHPCGYTLTPRDEYHYCAITIRGPWGECGIYDPQDIKPLALALLAHHYKNQKEHP